MAEDRTSDSAPAEELNFSESPARFDVPPPTVNVLDALALPNPGALAGPASPEYLRYNARGRAWHERMFYNAGSMYMLGIGAGGLYGSIVGLRTSPSPRFRVRLNTFLNATSRYGSKAGNAMGVLAVMYSMFETGLDQLDVDQHIPTNFSIVPIIAAMGTGALYKSRNPRTAVLASVAGGLTMGAMTFAKDFLPSSIAQLM